MIIIMLFVWLTEASLMYNQDPWFEVHRVSRFWRQEQVLYPAGPCEPCQLMIQLYHEKIVFSFQGNLVDVSNCTLPIPSLDDVTFGGKSYEVSGNCGPEMGKIEIKVQYQPQDGVYWYYTVIGKDVNLYAKFGEVTNSKILYLICGVFILLSNVFFPLNKKKIQLFLEQTNHRTSLITLILYLQLLSIIILYQLLFMIFYLIYAEHYLLKIASYCIFGICFLYTTIVAGYCFAGLQQKLNKVITAKGYKCILINFMFVLVVIGYPFAMCLFVKGMWFFVLSTFGVVLQFIFSLMSDVKPLGRFLVLYLIHSLYMAILSTAYPIANFLPLPAIDIVILVVYEVVLFLLGSLLVEKKVVRQSTLSVDYTFNGDQTPGSSNFQEQIQMK